MSGKLFGSEYNLYRLMQQDQERIDPLRTAINFLKEFPTAVLFAEQILANSVDVAVGYGQNYRLEKAFRVYVVRVQTAARSFGVQMNELDLDYVTVTTDNRRRIKTPKTMLKYADHFEDAELHAHESMMGYNGHMNLDFFLPWCLWPNNYGATRSTLNAMFLDKADAAAYCAKISGILPEYFNNHIAAIAPAVLQYCNT